MFSACKYINKIQIKKYLVNIIQLINKEQRTMNRSNSTACGSWGSYSFDSNLSADYPGRIIGHNNSSGMASHYREHLDETVLWGAHRQNEKDTHKNKGTSDEELTPTWRNVNCEVQETWTDCLLEQLKHGAPVFDLAILRFSFLSSTSELHCLF